MVTSEIDTFSGSRRQSSWERLDLIFCGLLKLPNLNPLDGDGLCFFANSFFFQKIGEARSAVVD